MMAQEHLWSVKLGEIREKLEIWTRALEYKSRGKTAKGDAVCDNVGIKQEMHSRFAYLP